MKNVYFDRMKKWILLINRWSKELIMDVFIVTVAETINILLLMLQDGNSDEDNAKTSLTKNKDMSMTSNFSVLDKVTKMQLNQLKM